MKVGPVTKRGEQFKRCTCCSRHDKEIKERSKEKNTTFTFRKGKYCVQVKLIRKSLKGYRFHGSGRDDGM